MRTVSFPPVCSQRFSWIDLWVVINFAKFLYRLHVVLHCTCLQHSCHFFVFSVSGYSVYIGYSGGSCDVFNCSLHLRIRNRDLKAQNVPSLFLIFISVLT
eukprot:sb/3478727/